MSLPVPFQAGNVNQLMRINFFEVQSHKNEREDFFFLTLSLAGLYTSGEQAPLSVLLNHALKY